MAKNKIYRILKNVVQKVWGYHLKYVPLPRKTEMRTAKAFCAHTV